MLSSVQNLRGSNVTGNITETISSYTSRGTVFGIFGVLVAATATVVGGSICYFSEKKDNAGNESRESNDNGDEFDEEEPFILDEEE